MAKRKGKTVTVRINADTYQFLKKISESDPIRPRISQLIAKLVKTQGYTLDWDQRAK